MESLKFQAELSHRAKAPTEFRMLNTGHPVLLGNPEDTDDGAYQAVQYVRAYLEDTIFLRYFSSIIFKFNGLVIPTSSSWENSDLQTYK